MKAAIFLIKCLVLFSFLITKYAAAQSWELTGNAGTDPNTNFIGTSDNKALVFKTNNNEAFRITTNGNIAINQATPSYPLSVNGHIGLMPNTSGQLLLGRYSSAYPFAYVIARSGVSNGSAGLIFRTADSGNEKNSMVISSTGNAGIGTTQPSMDLEVISKKIGGGIKVYGDASTGSHNSPGFHLEGKDISGTLRKSTLGLALSDGHYSRDAGKGDLVLRSQDNKIIFSTVSTNSFPASMTIQNNGDVGIGTTAPRYSLDVQGSGITYRHSNGSLRTVITNEAGGQSGAMATYGANGKINTIETSTAQNPNLGGLGVYDDNGNAQAYLIVDLDRRGYVVADVKSFRVSNPHKSGTDIVYASIEGPEAAAYVRGTARLKDGKANIEFPDHFKNVINPKGMTIQLTPLSADSLGLAIVEKDLKGFVVKELHKGKGNYEFDWEVKSTRKGYENYKVIRPAKEMRLSHIGK